MNNVWFTSDTHFGHKNIIKYESAMRPFSSIEENDETLIENWNKVVKKNDLVWHLGDVCFGLNTLHRVMPKLKGVKRLVLGNHDVLPTSEYLKYFDRIFGVIMYKNFMLSHVPIRKENLRGVNIHGHLHSKVIQDESYFNVSVERHNLTPITFNKIKERYE